LRTLGVFDLSLVWQGFAGGALKCAEAHKTALRRHLRPIEAKFSTKLSTGAGPIAIVQPNPKLSGEIEVLL
jgi:hypothetical protein